MSKSKHKKPKRKKINLKKDVSIKLRILSKKEGKQMLQQARDEEAEFRKAVGEHRKETT